MPDIGATLREARMRARIDISELEAETKIRAKYLRALENEEWDLLPGPTYVKSFLREYADALGLDGKLLVAEYKLRNEGPSDFEMQPISPRSSRARERQRRRTPSGALRDVAVAVVILPVLGGRLPLRPGGGGGKHGHGRPPCRRRRPPPHRAGGRRGQQRRRRPGAGADPRKEDDDAREEGEAQAAGAQAGAPDAGGDRPGVRLPARGGEGPRARTHPRRRSADRPFQGQALRDDLRQQQRDHARQRAPARRDALLGRDRLRRRPQGPPPAQREAADLRRMSASAGIVVTGTEVLTGQILDRNGGWISERLRELGVEHSYTLVVGDRPE